MFQWERLAFDCETEKAAKAPLEDIETGTIYDLVMASEELFGSPQDVEWTFKGPRQTDDFKPGRHPPAHRHLIAAVIALM